MPNQKTKPGPHKQQWARKTWIHKATGAIMVIERDTKKLCEYMFHRTINDPAGWREKK